MPISQRVLEIAAAPLSISLDETIEISTSQALSIAAYLNAHVVGFEKVTALNVLESWLEIKIKRDEQRKKREIERKRASELDNWRTLIESDISLVAEQSRKAQEYAFTSKPMFCTDWAVIFQQECSYANIRYCPLVFRGKIDTKKIGNDIVLKNTSGIIYGYDSHFATAIRTNNKVIQIYDNINTTGIGLIDFKNNLIFSSPHSEHIEVQFSCTRSHEVKSKGNVRSISNWMSIDRFTTDFFL